MTLAVLYSIEDKMSKDSVIKVVDLEVLGRNRQ